MKKPNHRSLLLKVTCAGIFKQCMGARNWVGIGLSYRHARARICKRLRRPGIDSEDSIPYAYAAWRASTTKRVVGPARQDGNRFLGSFKGLQIRALATQPSEIGSLKCSFKVKKNRALLTNSRHFYFSFSATQIQSQFSPYIFGFFSH